MTELVSITLVIPGHARQRVNPESRGDLNVEIPGSLTS
jgi:hypothetical protein